MALSVRIFFILWLKTMVAEFIFSLTQGLLVGLGTCLSYIPAVTVTPGWYDKRRALAMGIVLSGWASHFTFWIPAADLTKTESQELELGALYGHLLLALLYPHLVSGMLCVLKVVLDSFWLPLLPLFYVGILRHWVSGIPLLLMRPIPPVSVYQWFHGGLWRAALW